MLLLWTETALASCWRWYYHYIPSSTTTTITVTTTAAAAIFPADDALDRLDNGGGDASRMMIARPPPSGSCQCFSKSFPHPPQSLYTPPLNIRLHNSVTDAATTDKVLSSSLVSDRVKAVYSFISANPLFRPHSPSYLSINHPWQLDPLYPTPFLYCLYMQFYRHDYL